MTYERDDVFDDYSDPDHPIQKVLADNLVVSINQASVFTARKYLSAYKDTMSSAELIGCYSKIVDSGLATDAEECALLDLVDPNKAY